MTNKRGVATQNEPFKEEIERILGDLLDKSNKAMEVGKYLPPDLFMLVTARQDATQSITNLLIKEKIEAVKTLNKSQMTATYCSACIYTLKSLNEYVQELESQLGGDSE